jgi:hypothetical protein
MLTLKTVKQGSSLHQDFLTFSGKESFGTACAKSTDQIK